MERKNENLSQCANYLVQLFYKTGKRYSCTRTKIGKLLSILAFKYATQGMRLFHEKIYRYSECGTAIAEIMWKFDPERDVYCAYPYDDKKKIILTYELNEETDIPERYEDIKKLTSEIKREIEDIFFYFGAYSQVDLSEELNPIVEYEGICLSDSSIDLEAIAHLDKEQFPNNKVVEYIFK